METITRTSCRLCGSGNLGDVFSLGEQYINDFVPKEMVGKGMRAPLDLVICCNCKLLQLRHTAPQELLYSRHYWYRSGINPVIIKDLKQITEIAQRMVQLKKKDIVLDIGANDGTMLKYYSKDLIKVGCEPANNLIEKLRNVTSYVIHDFWSYKAWENKFEEKKAKIITAIGMFYDMENPNHFIRDAAKALDENGIFIAQLMCLRPMLEKNDIGNICHEHLEFYSYNSLVYLFEKNGLEIFKVEENNINGGSYRIFARHYKNGSINFNEDITKKDYQNFYQRIKRNKKLCVNFIKQETKKGKKVYVYGASTKGNTILQYYGLDNKLITGAADRSKEKWGKYTIGTWIPIVSEEEAREKADYFLVLPWAFFYEFYKREKEWRLGGGKFIVPLPNFRVVA